MGVFVSKDTLHNNWPARDKSLPQANINWEIQNTNLTIKTDQSQNHTYAWKRKHGVEIHWGREKGTITQGKTKKHDNRIAGKVSKTNTYGSTTIQTQTFKKEKLFPFIFMGFFLSFNLSMSVSSLCYSSVSALHSVCVLMCLRVEVFVCLISLSIRAQPLILPWPSPCSLCVCVCFF